VGLAVRPLSRAGLDRPAPGLAANTAFADFPRLASIARDRFVPRVFQFRGDRLAFPAASSCSRLSLAC
jgi:hypothetical protein